MPIPALVMLTLADARLPTGGYTQSGGLEPAVASGLGEGGRRIGDVISYGRGRLRSIVGVEAGTAVVARHLTATGRDPLAVEAYWAARTPSHVLRSNSREQGRGYLRLASKIWPGVLDHLEPDSEVPRAIVVGTVGAVTGLSPVDVARLVAYDDTQTVMGAATKLLPVDPAETAAWALSLHPEIEAVVARTSSLTEPEQLPATGAPLVDAFAHEHTTARMRLFHG